jgi:hypothetical protein
VVRSFLAERGLTAKYMKYEIGQNILHLVELQLSEPEASIPQRNSNIQAESRKLKAESRAEMSGRWF